MPKPTGHLLRTPEGCDLVLERAFECDVHRAWALITDPDLLDQWFGRWSGDAGPGKTIQVVMRFEEADEPQDVVIEECIPPRYLGLKMGQGSDAWRFSLELTPGPLGAGLRLSHHLSDPALAASIGPGWDYYLDMLAATQEERDLPGWDDYYPALATHYAQAATQLGE